ncbi:DNA repair protein [Flagelloscypha sp. PMI_526]|nr:DNA repair protein [Flagelloscypha sp. PMI_526]
MHAAFSASQQQSRIDALELEIAALQARLQPNEDPEKIIQRHIQHLHVYNEAKDATQILIGRLATLKESTVKQIHEDYDLLDPE